MLEMVMEFLAENFDKCFFSLIAITIISAFLMDIRDKNYPPSPMGLPFFGYIPMLNNKAPYLSLMELSQQYGRVFGIKLGSVDAVVVADVKLIKEALENELFHSTPPMALTHGIKSVPGLTGAEGQTWKDHRNLVYSTLENIAKVRAGSSKAVMEEQIQHSVREFIADLKSDKGSGQDILPALSQAVGLLLIEVVSGNRFDKDHPDIKVLQDFIEESSRVDTVTSLLNYVPWLKQFSNYANTYNSFVNGKEKVLRIYENFMDKASKSDFVKPNNIRCVMDAYSVEMNERESESRVGTFTKAQIKQVMADLVGTGWDTTLTTLKWLYLYMAIYPDVQEKVAEEVAKVAEKSGEVTIEDTEQLPYTNATIMEIWRHRSILPLGVPHFTKEDTKIGEYLIQKNSMIIPLLWAVHHDSRIWEKPDIFSPERFLNEDGSLLPSENLIPFQTGKRACVGENLARRTVQLFFANTVHQFQIELPKGFAYNFEEAPECGTTLMPRPYQLHLNSRH